MVSRRGFRYRIYPTPKQETLLRQWEGALRVLWNIANEQRRLYLARGQRMSSAFDQILELTALRAEAVVIAGAVLMSWGTRTRRRTPRRRNG